MNSYTAAINEFIERDRAPSDVNKLSVMKKKFGKPGAFANSPKEAQGDNGIFKSALMLSIAIVVSVFLFTNKSNETVTKPQATPPSATQVENSFSQMSADAQAMYWTYAIYDYSKLKEIFQVSESLVISQSASRKNLERLIPLVSSSTLQKIASYDHKYIKKVTVK